MSRAEGFDDIAVILAALIRIAYEQRNRRAGGRASMYTGQDLHLIGFLALRHVARRPRAASGERMLDVGGFVREPRWSARDNGTDRRPMGFAEVRDTEEFA